MSVPTAGSGWRSAGTQPWSVGWGFKLIDMVPLNVHKATIRLIRDGENGVWRWVERKII